MPRPADASELLQRSRSLSACIDEHAQEGERARRVPDEVFDLISSAGLTSLTLSRSLGGSELDPVSAMAIIEEISRADGSTGWVTMILNGSLAADWLDPDAARAMVASGDFHLAGMFGPLGKATPDGDGFRLTGLWPFNSGSVHATWVMGGCFVMDGDRPATRTDGRPDWRFAFFPAAASEIHDTWHASGLRASSSHDVSVTDLFVPAAHLAAPMFDPQRQPGPYANFTFFARLTPLMVAFVLGVARRAIDEATSLCRHKSRAGNPPLIEDAAVQLDLLRSEHDLRAARTYALDAAARAWESACSGRPLTIDERLDIRFAASNAFDVGIRVVDRCFRLGGGGALYDHSPLQRCWRDMHAASHHLFNSDPVMREYGAVFLGLQPDSIQM